MKKFFLSAAVMLAAATMNVNAQCVADDVNSDNTEMTAMVQSCRAVSLEDFNTAMYAIMLDNSDNIFRQIDGGLTGALLLHAYSEDDAAAFQEIMNNLETDYKTTLRIARKMAAKGMCPDFSYMLN